MVPSVRLVSESKVMMTNLLADGSGVYGKHQALLESRNYRPQSTDPLFMSLKINRVLASAREIIKLANRKNIRLPIDDPLTLLVHPDGSFKVMMLDIGPTKFNKKNPGRFNISAAEALEWWLKEIRMHIGKGFS